MSKTILICDDDDGIVDMLEILFDGSGFNTITLTDSLQLISTIEKTNPDLLLLDLWMPVLSGDQVLKNIRKNPATAHLPVIVVSASRDGEKIAKDAGANDFVAKPFDMDLLIDRVDRLIGTKATA